MANAHRVHHTILHKLSLVLLTCSLLRPNAEAINRDAEKAALLNLERHWGKPVTIYWSSIKYTDQCNWPGVICTNGFVTEISLTQHNLDKPIPTTICSFQNLLSIDLSHNNIPGSFPTILFNCLSLQHLDLSYNAFDGFLPSNIHLMSPRLSYLNLASNLLHGSIPSSIGQLHELLFLYLDDNLFVGSYPAELGQLSALQVLSLAHNPFAPGRIQPQFGNLTNLEYLWMSNMNIVGEIPDIMSKLTQLRLLDLSYNSLNGTIPSGIWRLKNLEMLYLYDNSLSGKISGTVEATNLIEINVSTNQLTGQIPEDFGKLKNLTLLLLYDNQLSGSIPKSISLLPRLHALQFSNNLLSGVLPKELGKHSMLHEIDLSYNSLSGELPVSISSCMSLRTIKLYNNHFTGRFPAGIWSLPKLKIIMIQENAFSGSLPSELGSYIATINISNNRFTGTLPMLAENLSLLMAENNLISGEIPTHLFEHAPLQVLLLAGNMLSGILPSSIWSTWNLKQLDLRKNNLSGKIPGHTDTSRWSTVDRVDLSENNLSGPVPESLTHLQLLFLNLSCNQLTGQIPFTFQIKRYEHSFLFNPGLCSSDHFGNLSMCIEQTKEQHNVRGKHLKRPVIIFLVIIGSTILICIGLFGFIKIRVFFTRQKDNVTSPWWKLTTFQPINYNIQDILCGLTDQNLVGCGGSGKVYKICLDNPDFEVIAVKKIWTGLQEHGMLEKQFQAEIETLGSIRHANLVKLFGYISSSESKLLIYEYMEHSSLYEWLHRKDLISETVQLNWRTRMSIAIDAARGLSYMHHGCSPPIAHRDVKSSNILLDPEFKAKIADFGLARPLIKTGEPESVSATVGTFGYIAPEFGSSRKINEKVDVYSFGVVLLELTTGRLANGGGGYENLAQWAWRQFQDDSFQLADVIDTDIRDPAYLREVQLVFKLGLICTGTTPSSRPSMKEVLQVLQKNQVLQC